jgi:hypothetical protein
MRLYTSGVKVPLLGSFQDNMLRKFLMQEAHREIQKTGFLVNMALASVSDPEQARQLRSNWSAYINMELGIPAGETDSAKLEAAMMQEYEKVRKLKPRLINRDGKLSVTGLK